MFLYCVIVHLKMFKYLNYAQFIIHFIKYADYENATKTIGF